VAHLIPSVPFSCQHPFLKHLPHSDNIKHNDSIVFYNPSIVKFTSPKVPEAAFIATIRGMVNEFPAIKEDLPGCHRDTGYGFEDIVRCWLWWIQIPSCEPPIDMHKSINFSD
jgi:hypothetical protein